MHSEKKLSRNRVETRWMDRFSFLPLLKDSKDFYIFCFIFSIFKKDEIREWSNLIKQRNSNLNNEINRYGDGK